MQYKKYIIIIGKWYLNTFRYITYFLEIFLS